MDRREYIRVDGHSRIAGDIHASTLPTFEIVKQDIFLDFLVLVKTLSAPPEATSRLYKQLKSTGGHWPRYTHVNRVIPVSTPSTLSACSAGVPFP